MTGTLYVVGTPIGHLGDITLRAIETLRHADRIVAEDTRRTRALLSHLAIRGKPLQCVEAHADAGRIRQVTEQLLAGQNVALVTDAGMPAVSDPGARLVSAAISVGAPVQVVPGASAVTAALALSGIVEGPFYFLGFLPREGKRRRAAVGKVLQCSDAVVLFESPHRIGATLRELAELQPERPAIVCRELTKMHEEVKRGTLSALCAEPMQTRGEFVLVLGAPSSESLQTGEEVAISDEYLIEQLNQGQSPRTVLEQLGVIGHTRRELYARLIQLAETLVDDAVTP
jgi:16S rRNA (cytidine1402-2'-O)-methyltransferase